MKLRTEVSNVFKSTCFIGVLWLYVVSTVKAQPSSVESLNLTSFTLPVAAIPSSLDSSDLHPDYGRLPFYSLPCDSCFEVLSKRQENARTFVRLGASGKSIFTQRSVGAINYKDENGFWRDINPSLRPDTLSGVFISDRQPVSITIHTVDRATSLSYQGHRITFNRNIHLLHRDNNGNETDLGSGNWSSFTAGDDGIRFSEFYPGVDLVLMVRRGELESGFLIKRRLPFANGELVLSCGLGIPPGFSCASIRPGSLHSGFMINDQLNNAFASIRPCFAYDNAETPALLPLSTSLDGATFEAATPMAWLNDPIRKYPVLIDPTLSTQGVLNNGAGGVSGSQYSATCWTNGCDYNLTVSTPANAQLVRVLNSFEYYAVAGLCQAQDGGYSIQSGSCVAPAAVPGVFTCSVPQTNYYCAATNVDIFPDIASCLPPDQCASQNLNFTLHFFHCNNDPDPNCSENCIRASQPWVITLESRDLELPFVTPDAQICSGDELELTAVPQFGIAPYGFSWSSLGTGNDTVVVAPAVTSTYTLVVNDACGVTRTATSTVTVLSNINPGFSGSSFSVCTNESITLNAFGASPATSYHWVVPGSSAPAGIVDGATSTAISYTLPGQYPVTMEFRNGSCVADSTILVQVNAPVPLDVQLIANPTGVICPGDPVVFHAFASNAGTAPVYSFYLNGSLQLSSAMDSMKLTNLQNGDIVQVVLQSNADCLLSNTDTASLFIAVSGTVEPAVSLITDIDACVGNTVIFTAQPLNGGTAPSFQWYLNGAAVAGANQSTFSTLISGSDTSVSVVMNSSLTCVTTSFASASYPVAGNSSTAVSIQALPNDTLCLNGTPAEVKAFPVNGGVAPIYQWFLNGVPTTDTTAIFSSSTLGPGDRLQVTLISSSPCVSPSTASSNIVEFKRYPPLSLLFFGAPPVCEGTPVVLHAGARGGTGGPYSYRWEGQTTDSDSLMYIPTTSEYVDVMVSDACGTTPVIDSGFVVVKPNPEADFVFSPAAPNILYSTVNFTDRSVGASSWLWNFDDGNNSFLRNPMHTFNGEGSFEVSLIAFSTNGCVDTFTYTLVVRNEMAIFFPNSFTPNGDAMNDTWTPLSVSAKSFSILIIDRWGQKVFEGNELLPWNGTHLESGDTTPEGVYQFVVTLNDPGYEGATYSGRITLIR